MQEKLQSGNVRIESYNLPDFLMDLQEAVLDGYRLNIEDNDCYPHNFGTIYSVVMIPERAKVLPALLKPPAKVEAEPIEQELGTVIKRSTAPSGTGLRGRPKAS